MLPDTFKASNRELYTMGPLIAPGGQGEAYEVTEQSTGRTKVLKLFYCRFSDSRTRQRTEWLISQNLSALSPLLKAPEILAEIKGRLGHIAPMATGEDLEEMLKSISWTFDEGLLLGIAIAKGVSVCEEIDMGLGDISATNIRLCRSNTWEASLIDLDNFTHADVPKPRMAGNKLYMAKEILEGGNPCIESDRYSLMVVLHEVIFLCHPLHGCDSDEDSFYRAVKEGVWKLDPAYVRKKASTEGYPPEVLTPRLHRLFRKAASGDAASRPPAREWADELLSAFKRVYSCPGCGGLFVADCSKLACPLCKEKFPPFVLECPIGTIALDRGAIALGRKEIGGGQHVSRRHVIFRKVGPGLWLEDISSTGVFRKKPDGTWTPLAPRVEIPVQHGDHLRFGDVEVYIR